MVRGKRPPIDGHNNIYLIDLADGSISTPYSAILKELDVRTPAEGLHEYLENGDVFIEEQEHGRILRVSPKHLTWEFTAKVDDDTLAYLNWSRYLTKERVRDLLPVLEATNCL